MKNYILILAMRTTELCVAQTDTVRVQITNDCYNFMPGRGSISLETKYGDTSYSYTDSIRVCGQIINKNGQRYYLIVTDSSGNKRLEGNFFDSYADGHVINYDAKGRKTAEGDYLMRKKRFTRHKYSVQTGYWYYYDVKGKRIRTQKFD